MKPSFLGYILDKIKWVFLTLFTCCLFILPKFRRHTSAKRIEDTEYYEHERDLKCIQRTSRPTTTTTTNNVTKIAAEQKIVKSSEQRKEEHFVQREERRLVKNLTKHEAVAKIKQKIEKCQEKLKVVKRDSKKQRDILRNIAKCKPLKIETCHDQTKDDSAAQQLKTRAILRDFPKIEAIRIEKNHEHHKEKKYREYKAQEILMNVTMSEAEKMRATIKNYSAQRKEKREEKRRHKEAADMIRDGARKLEQIYESNKKNKYLQQRARESYFKDTSKDKAPEIVEKVTIYNEPRKKKKYCPETLREMGRDVPKSEVGKAEEKLKRGSEQCHREKHMPSEFPAVLTAASTNDVAESKKMGRYQDNKQLSKNFTTTTEVDTKKKLPKEVRQLLGGSNEVVKKNSKTNGVKDRMEMVKHSPEKLEVQLQRDTTMILKDNRKKDFTKAKELEVRDKLKILQKPDREQKQLHRDGTITIKNNKTSSDLDTKEKKALHRDGTIIIKADIAQTKMIETKQKTWTIEEPKQVLREEKQLIADEVKMSAQLRQQPKLLRDEQQQQREDNELMKMNVKEKDMEILEKLRIMHELEKVEEQLLENEKILDFLTSDEDDFQEQMDELQTEVKQMQEKGNEINKTFIITAEEGVENEREIRHNPELVEKEKRNEMKNKEKQTEDQKLLHRKSEEVRQKLNNTEVVEIAPIIETYAETKERENKFHIECEKMAQVDYVELEYQKKVEKQSKNVTSDALKMKVKISCSSELSRKMKQQLQEKANELVNNASTHKEMKLEEKTWQPTCQENELKQLCEEEIVTVKDMTKEIVEMIMKCLMSEKMPMDDLRLENLEEKVKEKLEEQVVEKIMNKNLTTNKEMQEKQTAIDAKQIIKDVILTQELNKDSKQAERGLQLQLRDIISETNEIDEVKIVTAVVVLMTNIIERVCQQQL